MSDDRGSKGKFKPGASANPKGRPRNRLAEQIRARLFENADEILEKWLQSIREGDSAALKLAIERLLPAYKAEAIPTQLADLHKALQSGKTARDLGRVILKTVAAGELDVSSGGRLLQALGVSAQLDELEELRERLARLDPNDVTDLV